MLQWEHSAILSSFIKLPFAIEISVLSIFEWPFYIGFTVYSSIAPTTCQISKDQGWVDDRRSFPGTSKHDKYRQMHTHNLVCGLAYAYKLFYRCATSF